MSNHPHYSYQYQQIHHPIINNTVRTTSLVTKDGDIKGKVNHSNEHELEKLNTSASGHNISMIGSKHSIKTSHPPSDYQNTTRLTYQTAGDNITQSRNLSTQKLFNTTIFSQGHTTISSSEDNTLGHSYVGTSSMSKVMPTEVSRDYEPSQSEPGDTTQDSDVKGKVNHSNEHELGKLNTSATGHNISMTESNNSTPTTKLPSDSRNLTSLTNNSNEDLRTFSINLTPNPVDNMVMGDSPLLVNSTELNSTVENTECYGYYEYEEANFTKTEMKLNKTEKQFEWLRPSTKLSAGLLVFITVLGSLVLLAVCFILAYKQVGNRNDTPSDDSSATQSRISSSLLTRFGH